MKSVLAAFPLELLLLSLFTFALHALTSGGYGYFRDELYFIACGKRLAWGYVDQPPLAPAIASFSSWLSGGSLALFRLPAAVAHALTVLLTGFLALRLGSDRAGALLASSAALVSPYLLVNGYLLTMNAFEPLLWTLTVLAAIYFLRDGSPTTTVALGLIVGIGILNKHSMAFFAVCVLGGILVMNPRLLASKWTWLAVGIAALLALPHLLWQVKHDFPILELLRNGKVGKNAEFDASGLVGSLILENHPLTLVIWVSGLFFLLFADAGREFRWLGLAALLLFVVFFSLKAKPYYFAPLFPLLFAAGGLAASAWLSKFPVAPLLAAAVVLIGGMVTAPLAIPLLRVETLIEYQRWLGVEPVRTENKAYNSLPQHIADQFGWPEIVEAVERAYANVPESERGSTAIFASNYGEAGAIELLGDGLPRPTSGHNNYYLWGPQEGATTWIAVGGSKSAYERYFNSVEQAAESASNQFAMPYQNRTPVYIVRSPKLPIREIWRAVKSYN